MIEALLARLSPSTKIIVGLLVVLGVLAVGAKLLWKENTKLELTNAVQTQTLHDVGTAQALTDKTDAVTEQSAVETVQVVAKLTADQEVVDNDVTQKVADIKKQYAAEPQTPDNTKLRNDAVSVVRLTGLWDTYCAGPGNASQTGCTQRRTIAGLPH